MIKLRATAGAILINNGDFLLMKRSMNKKFAPGVWAGVGGHLEPDELNNPQKTCIREIYEETGIQEKDLENLKLKYIILYRNKDEVGIQYMYTAEVKIRQFTYTDEGELFWIKESQLFDRELGSIARMTLNHYVEFGRTTDDILVGTVSLENEQPVINWNPVKDLEGLI